ncbi:hypothetical protein FRB96_006863 [Tulasnella sp. 330]|nr:hypothetical protein FRB96_006863 [Tulasnella sp. 330]KAG8873683.1 hypothetical protein FRB97_006539 [Tulasnella sp. 331]KAG8878394.1 hypothetical protein FRB98_006130 [Tulasnella sp. 332]
MRISYLCSLAILAVIGPAAAIASSGPMAERWSSHKNDFGSDTSGPAEDSGTTFDSVDAMTEDFARAW